jgi:hypothetical protein
MPRIQDGYLQSIVYLYKSPEDAENGKKVGGTGFIIEHELKNKNQRMYFVVTNAHVVEGISAPGAIRFNTIGGGTSIAQVYKSDWQFHPLGDDIAIGALNAPPEIFLKLQHSSISTDMFLTENIMHANDIGPGNETFVAGRFIKHDGTKTNTPIVRCGNVSMMPQEPVVLANGHEQLSFLVESRSLSGFSGSPVFVYANQPFPEIKNIKRGLLLLGLDCGHLNIYESLKSRNGESITDIYGDNTVSVSNSGQMIVVPAWKIYEMITIGPIADRIKEIETWGSKNISH